MHQNLITTIVEAKRTRKDHIIAEVLVRKPKMVGNLVYEPASDDFFYGNEVTHDLSGFKAWCDLIVANRWSADLRDVSEKVYTRDVFYRD